MRSFEEIYDVVVVGGEATGGCEAALAAGPAWGPAPSC